MDSVYAAMKGLKPFSTETKKKKKATKQKNGENEEKKKFHLNSKRQAAHDITSNTTLYPK